MARLRWFIAGAAAATGALVSVPDAYKRLREALPGGGPKQLPAGAWPERDSPSAAPASAATTAAPEPPTAPAGPEDNDPADSGAAALEDDATRELRQRIEETRARIQQRAHDVSASEFDASP